MSDPIRVLLIGESAPGEGSLRAQLESLGFEVVPALTPEDAHRLVEGRPVDLVLVDSTDRNFDAFVLIGRMKRVTHDLVVPVMLAAAPGDRRAEVTARDVGVDDCFTVPIDTEVLAARIRLVLRNRDLERWLRRQNRDCLRINAELIEAREGMRQELQLASRIQRSLLPARFPVLDRFRFAASLISSGAVSGDFYDIYRLDETHYGFYVADAIGHGVPAALLTIFVKKGLQTRDVVPGGYRLLDPGEVLRRLSRDIMAEKLSDNPFVTLAYSILDAATGKLTFASGGHPSALMLRADGTRESLDAEGALLGIFESDYETSETTLRPGDRVFLYTDGLDDAQSPSGAVGLDAFVERFAAAEAAAPAGDDFETRVKDVLAEVFRNIAGTQLHDDVTVLVLKAV